VEIQSDLSLGRSMGYEPTGSSCTANSMSARHMLQWGVQDRGLLGLNFYQDIADVRRCPEKSGMAEVSPADGFKATSAIRIGTNAV
jgi:hypothetical protein